MRPLREGRHWFELGGTDDVDPPILAILEREWALLDTHDTLTDRYKHLRGPDEIRHTLTSLGLANVEVAVGGNGVEARARGAG